MTNAELHRTLEANPALAKRNDHLARALCHPKLKPAVRHEPLGEEQGKGKSTARIQVRFTAYRSRFIDPDNCVPKYLLDCLRHCGAIPDDSLQHVEVCVRQARAPAAHLQGTLIELIPIE